MFYQDDLLKLLRQHPEWKVLDLGAWEQPCVLATHSMDIMGWDKCGQQGIIGEVEERRISPETWLTHDVCATPWPAFTPDMMKINMEKNDHTVFDRIKGYYTIPDKYFDFVICSNVVEDVRDPIGLINEMCRVGKAGYIEFPSVYCELNWDRDTCHTFYAYPGFWHHRWLVRYDKPTNCVMFLAKLMPLIEREKFHFDGNWERFIGDKKEPDSFEGYYWTDHINCYELACLHRDAYELKVKEFMIL